MRAKEEVSKDTKVTKEAYSILHEQHTYDPTGIDMNIDDDNDFDSYLPAPTEDGNSKQEEQSISEDVGRDEDDWSDIEEDDEDETLGAIAQKLRVAEQTLGDQELRDELKDVKKKYAENWR